MRLEMARGLSLLRPVIKRPKNLCGGVIGQVVEDAYQADGGQASQPPAGRYRDEVAQYAGGAQFSYTDDYGG
ncbi:MAG: hypothetical protein M5U34_33510 [Chloroflexi bacterium]|nr:hypothetical protein [Chloroflexota bacterium]